MNNTAYTLPAVNTNIITGFLGVGKTTTIQKLLKQKPASERWAVLVNEFGEIGIDGALISPNHDPEQIQMLEVPGGCMCCSAGLALDIAINQILSLIKPDRLIIEPTGLGHPQEIIDLLRQARYQEAISLRSTITLIDARKLSDEACVEDPIFRQQIQVGDYLIANKSDLYSDHDKQQLSTFVGDSLHTDYIQYSQYGDIPLSLLDQETKHNHAPLPKAKDLAETLPSTLQQIEIPETGYLSKQNKRGDYHCIGWLFDQRYTFDFQSLYFLLTGVDATRLKGVFRTEKGVIGFNLVDEVLSYSELSDSVDSRLELIGKDNTSWSDIGTALFDCLPEKTISAK